MPPETEITAELMADDLAPADTPVREHPDTVLVITFAAKTDLGRVRENNEDKFEWWEPADDARLANRGRLYAVADGMGGHAAGQIASEMALNAVGHAYYSGLRGSAEDALVRAIIQANAVVFDTARAIPSRNGMGCTIVALAVEDSDAVVAWAGDSRAYLVRGGVATQITRDHSFVEEQVQLGVLTPEEAKTHRYRNVITRSLGPEASVSPDVTRFALEAGDIVLLCSDGLTGTVSDDEIAEYAMAEAPSFACHELIGLANTRGGPDNITVAIIRVASPTDVGPVPPPRVSGEPPPKRRGLFRR